ncbi:FAD dependent oxidoreductase domain-containing protein [Sarocladium implicatum]|nr:FAD dependent oxidoreductase domain-containing protein [Sarocladium implicatum]
MAEANSQNDIVIVGAGIIGLYVSLVLAKRGHGRSTTVLAEYLPGDTAVAYTSPWAGCNFSAISGTDPNAIRWDKAGYKFLREIEATAGEKSFVKKTPSTEMWDDVVPHDKIKAMSEYLEDFEIIPAEKLPKGVKFAVSFTTVTINAPKFMEYLHDRLRNEYGVRFQRRKIDHIASAFAPSTKIVFNCTGNAAKFLGGVEDPKCYPTRGQVVLVRAPRVKRNTMRHGPDYETYIIPRPGTDGHVILGGYMQKGNDDGSTYKSETQSILERTKGLSEDLRAEKPEILATVAGMRPSREGGARVEMEQRTFSGQERALVHNYGAGGTGFQAGYGMALESVQQVKDILATLETARPSARL